ncbi:hypothetical protein PUNSTDRAFT_139970 [Punctularia strigosozonata HHB-11173 SS5]|uniref:uncharacterized protein n=1 Tax=Punctularia strigosozonata (strain HHB-11173) TaxID=741275 RepID=UPI00044164F0|nr:uncharacterized protein PUNSTDRAFT_139970 [Punctularia strigosozonata HHB-11173 SS5]EIN13421.1 hypothetical protein PUNSTDRAFT_139970 [Punctularia strigosozonata HHB-11173 SS5]
MARATRGSKLLEKESPEVDASATVTPAPKQRGRPGRKRKRQSTADVDGQPAAKISKSEDPDEVKEEPEPDGAEGKQPEETNEVVEHPDLPGSGEVPLHLEDAQKILDILEMVDTQGLLDRIFPLPEPETHALDVADSSMPQLLSFRNLLQDPSRHTLSVLRSAIQHLFPISSHPRSRPSTAASQQQHFCALALSLLDQASRNVAPVPLSSTTLLPPSPSSTDAPDPATTPAAPRNYALVQHLPTGDWWSSLSARSAGAELPPPSQLHDLGTAHAELVAVIPSPSDVGTGPPPPSLGSMRMTAPPRPKGPARAKPPGPRQLRTGSFLDYGPYASFAPTFDGESVEVGRWSLGEVLYAKEIRRRLREAAPQSTGEAQVVVDPGLSPQPHHAGSAETDDDVVMEVDGVEDSKEPAEENLSGLEDLLSPEEAEEVKVAVLGHLQLESLVEELLARNAKALARLEELQTERLRQATTAPGSSKVQVPPVEAGSEEWNLAQGIMDSLAILASLRPRSSTPDAPPLTPAPAILRKLHRTLPVQPAARSGWHGTLPATHPRALRDNTTLRVKPGVTIPAPTPAPAPAVASTPARTTASPATPYPVAYAARPAYQSYNATAAGYPYVPAPGQAPAPAYPAYGQAWQIPYPAQPTSGTGTPQPGATPATPVGSYAGFFANAAGTPTLAPQPQRAVANTVLSAAGKGAAVGSAWGGVAPTLPPHLRSSFGTPVAAAPGTPGYFGGYQSTPSR